MPFDLYRARIPGLNVPVLRQACDGDGKGFFCSLIVSPYLPSCDWYSAAGSYFPPRLKLSRKSRPRHEFHGFKVPFKFEYGGD